MEKNLKDYLHLYLGCDMLCVSNSSGDYEYIGRKVALTIDRLSLSTGKYLKNDVWKPVLRPLGDMVPGSEEANEWLSVKENCWQGRQLPIEGLGEIARWLLSKHFDLFGLIEAGLAIDKTTL